MKIKSKRRETAPDATPQIPSALAHFDSLPDSADVDVKVVAGLNGCSVSTVWRSVKSGHIPAPEKRLPGCTRWNVGKLRRARQ